MAICPSGHDSASDDFCDVCGVLIGAAPELAFDGTTGSSGTGIPGTAVPDGAQAAGTAAGGGPPAEACPQCGVTRAGQFCESCGYDFTAAAWAAPSGAAWTAAPAGVSPGTPASGPAATPPPVPAAPAPPAPGPSVPTSRGAMPIPPVPPVPAGAGPAAETVMPGVAVPDEEEHWAVVVTADRAYFDTVQAGGGPDAGSIAFPAYYPQRQFPLSGTEVRIGRRSVTSGITPEIDLSVPPADPGVSRLHAVLLRSPDGTWAVVDPGSANGTLVNGSEIPEGQVVPVRPGDLIHVGAWTAISVVTEP
jgi:FHA domain